MHALSTGRPGYCLLVQYVSEAVAALCEAPLRLSDVPAAVAVCSLLHQRYADFGAQMGPALAKVRVPGATCPLPTVMGDGSRCKAHDRGRAVEQ